MREVLYLDDSDGQVLVPEQPSASQQSEASWGHAFEILEKYLNERVHAARWAVTGPHAQIGRKDGPTEYSS